MNIILQGMTTYLIYFVYWSLDFILGKFKIEFGISPVRYGVLAQSIIACIWSLFITFQVVIDIISPYGNYYTLSLLDCRINLNPWAWVPFPY